MLSHFPHPYPGESLYSVLARYQARMQYNSVQAVVKEFFDTDSVVVNVNLPNMIDRLLNNIPQGHRYTADWFIEQCTALPFYAPFLPPERLRQIRRDMRGCGGHAIHTRAGLMSSSIPYPTWLRFCPQCIAADRSRFSEAYWHRLHQLSGVIVCPEHQVFLKDSSFRVKNAQNRYLHIAADEIDNGMAPDPVHNANPAHQHLINLATDAAWLLAQPITPTDPEVHRQRYLLLLAKHDLARYTGTLRRAKLIDKFIEFFTPQFLKSLHCTLNPAIRSNWLVRLIGRPQIAQHPLHHLLLIRFLKYSAEDFFKAPTQLNHFGVGPWPCLNPTCTNYQQAVINTCHVHYTPDRGRPVGYFACRCGFKYTRLGPERTSDDRFRINRVICYGTRWEDCLRRLWPDPDIGLVALARQLGVTPEMAVKQAVKLNLHFPRPGHRGRKKPVLGKKVKPKQNAKILQTKREYWLSLLAQYPTASLNELLTHNGATFSWLYRYDREWLKQHKLQGASPRLPTNGRVNWAKRDREIAQACLKAALDLLQPSTRPVRLTKSAIIRKAGHQSVVWSQPSKLPRTIKVLSSLAESRQDFALRRINWTATIIRNSGARLTRWKLINTSGVEHISNWPAVSQALDLAITAPVKSDGTIADEASLLKSTDQLIAKVHHLQRQFQNDLPE